MEGMAVWIVTKVQAQAQAQVHLYSNRHFALGDKAEKDFAIEPYLIAGPKLKALEMARGHCDHRWGL